LTEEFGRGWNSKQLQHFTHWYKATLVPAGSVHHANFPILNEAYLIEDTIEYPVQINGKLRTTVAFAADTPPQVLEKAVLELEAVQKWTEGKEVKKVIVVPKRMINIVVAG